MTPTVDIKLYPEPSIMSPSELLHLFVDEELYPHFMVMSVTFAAMFTVLTIVPQFLAVEPYNLSAGIIGVCYLPVGFAMLLGALLGGALSDESAKMFPQHPAGRLVFSLGGAFFTVVADVAFGFVLGYKANLAAVLIMQSLVGFGQAFYMPGNLGHCSAVKQDVAAAAGAVTMFFCFASAAVSISVSVVFANEIGIEYYYLILAGLTLVCSAYASHHIYIRLHNVKRMSAKVVQASTTKELISTMTPMRLHHPNNISTCFDYRKLHILLRRCAIVEKYCVPCLMI